MYEILSDVLPSNHNSGVAPEHTYIYIYIKFGWCNSKSRLKNTEITIKVNYTKIKQAN